MLKLLNLHFFHIKKILDYAKLFFKFIKNEYYLTMPLFLDYLLVWLFRKVKSFEHSACSSYLDIIYMYFRSLRAFWELLPLVFYSSQNFRVESSAIGFAVFTM